MYYKFTNHRPSYPACIILGSLPQLHKAAVQGGVLLLQNIYTNAVRLQLLLHVQKHISCTLNEQHVLTT